STLKQFLEKELTLTVRLIDPFERVEWADPRTPKPESPGTFAPLLGMMLDEAASVVPVIDFLHTRKKPAPPDQRRRYVYAAAAVAAVILLAFGMMQWKLWSLDSEINTLRIARFKQEKAAKDSAKPIKDAESLDAFAAGDVTWLDEFARLSEKLPPPEAAVVFELTAQTLPKGGGGQIKFVGHVDKSERVGELEENLRDKQHTVRGKGTNQDPDLPALQWAFDETVTVAPPAERPPIAATAKSAPAKAPAATKTTVPAKQGGAQ
ncbi:MAG TPA: hypothetical protein VKH44_05275, partial [Pirellulaceae bacterium]|nr:hypothetical protein [Pirellulaceae bacterium]